MDAHRLSLLANTLAEEAKRRNALGDYSQEAAGIRYLYEALWVVVDHIIHQESPKPKKKAKKK